MTPQELVNKIDYEGGIYEAAAGYGLRESDLDATATAEQKATWKKVVGLCMKLRAAVDDMYAIFPDVGGEE